MDWESLARGTGSSIAENVGNALVSVGRAGLHALSPDNFEYYMCSFELLDGYGNTVGFMTFPVLPNNISETKSQTLSITKTNSNVVTLFNPSFTPRDISIQGTFGRKLRIVQAKEPKNSENEENSFNKVANGELGIGVLRDKMLFKTGFGMVKLMERLTDKLYELDYNGNPHILIFTNYALNTRYVVEVLQRSFTQSTENNMMWFYNLEMKAVADANEVGYPDDKRKMLMSVFANSTAQAIGNILTDITKLTMQF